MKKHLLLLCLSLLGLGIAAHAADEKSVTFNYASGANRNLTLGDVTPGLTRIYFAFEFRKEDAAVFKGNSISSIIVRGGNGKIANNIKDPVLFITKELGATPLFMQTATLGARPGKDNVIQLDTPYLIEDDTPLYIGYSFLAPKEGTYLTLDNVPTVPGAFCYAVSDEEALPTKWFAVGDEYGALYSGIVISGTSMPENLVYLRSVSSPALAISGTTGDCSFRIANLGTKTITSFEAEVAVGDAAPQKYVFDKSVYLRSGSEQSYTAKEVAFVGEGSLPVSVSVTKINGADPAAVKSLAGSTVTYSNGYDRNLIIEEATGTWCGWCPSGIVMLDYAKTTYPDRFFAVAYHTGDEMENTASARFASQYASGYPYSITNRSVVQAPGIAVSAQRTFIDGIYDEMTSLPTYCRLDIDAEVSGNNLEVTAYTRFCVDINSEHGLSFILVEDKVGPYTQANNYAGGARGEMGGWEKKASTVSTVFDDVVRHVEGFPYIKNSIPVQVEKGSVNEYKCTLPLSGVKGANYRVIGLIVSGSTGQIINVGEWHPGKAGVGDIIAEDADAPVEYFNLQGVRVAEPSAGVYIRRCGSKVSKVYVK